MRKLITLAMLLALTGCAGMDRRRCTEYGYEQGSQAFADCMQNQDTKRSIALMNMSNQLQAYSLAHRSLTTHCSTFWGQTTCNTY